MDGACISSDGTARRTCSASRSLRSSSACKSWPASTTRTTSPARPKSSVTCSVRSAPGVTDRNRSSVGLTRSVGINQADAAVSSPAATSTGTRCRLTADASAGSSNERRSTLRGGRGGRARSAAGTINSVNTPHTSMPAPISSPSCCRLGKSTTSRPRNVAAVVHMPSSMLAAGPPKRANRGVWLEPCRDRLAIGDIHQDHAIDAEAEHHRRGAGGRGRERDAGQPQQADRDQERHRGRYRHRPSAARDCGRRDTAAAASWRATRRRS